MLPRSSLSPACAALAASLSASFLASPARADVAIPGHHILPAEAIFTGLGDFPEVRFVIAVIIPGEDAPTYKDLPRPTPVRDGEVVSISKVYFQQLFAIPAGTPDPVTDAWLAASNAPRSGSFTLHPRRVPFDSEEKAARARYHVRAVQSGWVALELLGREAVLAGGSTRLVERAVPESFQIISLTAPPGWRLFLMLDPAWPRGAAAGRDGAAKGSGAPALIPCAAGDILPALPEIRTLVAVEGSPAQDGSLTGKHPVSPISWGVPIHAFRRAEVPAASPIIAQRNLLEIEIKPGERLGVSRGQVFQDAAGQWFYDESATLPADMPGSSPRWWIVAGGAAGALAAAVWAWRRRRRLRRTSEHGGGAGESS